MFFFFRLVRNLFLEGADAKMILTHSFVFNSPWISEHIASAAASPISALVSKIFTISLSLVNCLIRQYIVFYLFLLAISLQGSPHLFGAFCFFHRFLYFSPAL